MYIYYTKTAITTTANPKLLSSLPFLDLDCSPHLQLGATGDEERHTTEESQP